MSADLRGGTVSLAAALALALAVLASERSVLLATIRRGAPVLLVLAVLGAFMLLQALPLDLAAHSVWLSAREVLPDAAGSISVDPGLTLGTLARLGAVGALGIAAALIAREPARARTLIAAAEVAAAAFAA